MKFLRKLLGRRPAPPAAPVGMGDVFGGPDDDTPYVILPGRSGTTMMDRLSFEYQSGRARGAVPSQASIEAALSRADRVRVLDGGLWRDEAIGVNVLLDTRV